MSAATDNTPSVELVLREVLHVFEPEDVPAVWDRLTEPGGVVDLLEALDEGDPSGALAENLRDALHSDPETAWEAILSDEGPELLIQAAEETYDHEDGGDDLGERFDAATEALHEQADRDNIAVDESAFAPHILAANGDLPAAYESWKAYFKTGAEPDLRDAFLAAADGDEERAAEGLASHREHSTEARAQLRAQRQEDLADLKAERIKSRPRGSDELGLNDAISDLHAASQASAELRESDSPEAPRPSAHPRPNDFTF